MKNIAKALQSYLQVHPLDTGDDDFSTVLDQLYLAYANSRESDPPEIQAGFAELETFLESLHLTDNNAVFNLACRLCTHHERKAFLDGQAAIIYDNMKFVDALRFFHWRNRL